MFSVFFCSFFSPPLPCKPGTTEKDITPLEQCFEASFDDKLLRGRLAKWMEALEGCATVAPGLGRSASKVMQGGFSKPRYKGR